MPFVTRISAFALLGALLPLLTGCGGAFLALMPRSEMRLPDSPPVYEGPDGRTYFGEIQCDQGGRYLGGGDAQGERSMANAFDRAIDETEAEINDIDRQIEACKGRTQTVDYYNAQFGCDRARLDDLTQRYAAVRSRVEPLNRQISDLDWRTRQNEARLQSDTNLSAAERGRLNDQAAKDTGRQMLLELEAGPLRAESTRLFNARQQMDQTCNRAYDAAWADPCYTVNVSDLHQARHRAQQQLAHYERRQEQFEDCVENRQRQTQAPSRDSAVPGLLLQQVLPGLLRPPPRRHPPSGHSHPEGFPGRRVIP